MEKKKKKSQACSANLTDIQLLIKEPLSLHSTDDHELKSNNFEFKSHCYSSKTKND